MIVFNEIQYAKDIIRNGCSKKNVLLDFKILAKYFLYYENKSEEDTRDLMLQILKDSETYIPINYIIPKINAAIVFAKSESLKTLDPIPVYKDELDVIQALPEDTRIQAFIYLFLSKWTSDPKRFFYKRCGLKKTCWKYKFKKRKIRIY